jgi:hypothetical protein
MTFESEEGIQRALHLDDASKAEDASAGVKGLHLWLGDQEIEIQKASEPSDIIWENRHFTPTQRLKKAIIVVLTIGFALLLSFVVVFVSRQYSATVAAKYPPVNCEPYYANYPDEQLQPFAIQEYKLNTAAEEAGRQTQYAGYLSCFC